MTEQFDRYLTFKDLNWEERADRIFAALQPHFDQETSPFWPYFLKQRAISHRQGLDDLRVLHNFLPTLRDLLEELNDTETLLLLEELEVLCM
ncbi:N(2)-fixation sustaining protein CowN [Gluconacetobacter azotocaptans]|uniref:N(2)-fixation sustaining protein CowN n=1 Tax=Gluconacetobacter azotocaptans TaxID=142834 RepID=A0A7W4JVT0_9PROT|nr:N(2)-fixation sustaining protein CowN [Gluconacetobacter azotocaptans]MBB2191823.1 N(2)-fixation sustaining protein CowN [Gluconacetobacter azotocaptans]MBM9403738.1 N(2)-fixation sustaining protein CowN [Gluconacetobacter azotocaptans]